MFTSLTPIHPHSHRLRVLVVEDDPYYRTLAGEALGGHERWFAGNAHEALELFRLHQPDVVFLDLGLPDDNGLHILLSIRQRQPEAFVVILTASRLGEDVTLAQRCAANGYITKPFSRKQLLSYCDAYMKHREKLEGLTPAQREAYHLHIRTGTEWMETRLHAPTPKAQAALHELLPRWNILLVGAEEAVRWHKALQVEGCGLTQATTGAEAIEKVKDKRFRLLIAEERLPDMEAAELVYRLRVNHQEVQAMVIADAEWKTRLEKWRKLSDVQVMAGPISDEKLRTLVEREVARNLHEADDIVLKT